MPRKLRILLIAPTLIPESGWGTFALNTTLGLIDRGHTVRVLVEKLNSNESIDQKSVLPSPLSLLDSRLARFRTRLAVRRAIREFQPDIVHYLVEPYALIAPSIRGIPQVMNLHGTYGVLPLTVEKSRVLLCHAYTAIDGLLVCSEYTKKRVLTAIDEFCGSEARKATEKKMQLFTLGINFTDQQSKKPDLPEKHILFVGELKPRKGLRELIDAFAAFKSRSKTAIHLDLVGKIKSGDPYFQSLETTIKDYGLHDHVTFHGHIDDRELNGLYASADLFMMLSKSEGAHFEGFGLVFLEANARGIPTIGSIDSGCKEAIDEGVSGFAVPAQDSELVADRMVKILDDNVIKAEDCIAWAKKHSVEQQVKAMEEFYLSLISRN